MANQDPVVFVHGLFGFGPDELGPLNYWGRAFKVPSALDRRYEASVGPVGSAHDRACELAAQIKGTVVDYGALHSHEAGHARFGRDYSSKGFVPEWSAANPVHLVGHSHGGPTIRCLQHLLAKDHFGWGSDHHWVKSLSAISGVLNGSPLVFMFGADEQTGLMKRDGICFNILKLVECYTGMTSGLINLNNIYDFDLDYWGYERRQDEKFSEYLDRVADCPFLWQMDNAPYSLTLQGAFEANLIWQTYPDTYYFSYVTEKTVLNPITGHYHPRPDMMPEMSATSTYIGSKVFRTPPIPLDGFDSADWWENDGLVPTWSQLFPRTSGNHAVAGEFTDLDPPESFQKGAWHYQWLRGMDHLDICLRPALNLVKRQELFYETLFQRLAGL